MAIKPYEEALGKAKDAVKQVFVGYKRGRKCFRPRCDDCERGRKLGWTSKSKAATHA